MEEDSAGIARHRHGFAVGGVRHTGNHAAQVASEISAARAHAATVLPLAAIPGATAFGNASGENISFNIAFPRGVYYYLVGVSYPKGTPNAPSLVQLSTAAKRLYARAGH